MENTRDLLKKTGNIKGTCPAKMDRNSKGQRKAGD